MTLEEVVCQLAAQTTLQLPIGLVSEGRILNDVAHPPLWASAHSCVAESKPLWGRCEVEWETWKSANCRLTRKMSRLADRAMNYEFHLPSRAAIS